MNNTRNRKTRSRKGASTVEFALVVPLLLAFVFGAIEFSRANMIRNMCENAAMEGARAGIVPGATADDCIADALDLINVMGLTNATVTVDPPVFGATTEHVTVTVNVPLTENALPMSKFILGKSLAQSVTLPREMQ